MREAERTAPLHMRPEAIARDLRAFLRDRRHDLALDQRQRLEAALANLEGAIGSIKTYALAKQGEIGPRPSMCVVAGKMQGRD